MYRYQYSYIHSDVNAFIIKSLKEWKIFIHFLMVFAFFKILDEFSCGLCANQPTYSYVLVESLLLLLDFAENKSSQHNRG